MAQIIGHETWGDALLRVQGVADGTLKVPFHQLEADLATMRGMWFNRHLLWRNEFRTALSRLPKIREKERKAFLEARKARQEANRARRAMENRERARGFGAGTKTQRPQ